MQYKAENIENVSLQDLQVQQQVKKVIEQGQFLTYMEQFGIKTIQSWELEQDQRLGEGGYGVVFSGTYKSIPVAINFFKDILPQCRIRHHKFVSIYGISYDKGLAVVTELCKENCESAIGRLLQPGNEKLLLRISYELADALNVMHQMYQMVHRDIKAANVLLDKNDHVKICDLGLARNLVDKPSTNLQQGVSQSKEQSSQMAQMRSESIFIEVEKFKKLQESTIRFMAPEYFKSRAVLTKSVDTYAYGCTLMQLWSGKLPFDLEGESLNKEISNQEVKNSLTKDKLPQIPQNIPPYIKNIIEGCLRKDPNGRPKLKDILTSFETIMNDQEEIQNRFQSFGMSQQQQAQPAVVVFHNIPSSQAQQQQNPQYQSNQQQFQQAQFSQQKFVSSEYLEIEFDPLALKNSQQMAQQQKQANPLQNPQNQEINMTELRRENSEEILWALDQDQEVSNNQQNVQNLALQQQQQLSQPSFQQQKNPQAAQIQFVNPALVNQTQIQGPKKSSVPQLPPINQRQNIIREVENSEYVDVSIIDHNSLNNVSRLVPDFKQEIKQQNVSIQLQLQPQNAQGQQNNQMLVLNANLQPQSKNVSVLQERQVRSTHFTQGNNFLSAFELQPHHYNQIQQDLQQTYIGDAPGQVPNGRGKKRFADGTVYDGQFKNGQFHGKGTCNYPDGGLYVGEFLDNKRQGTGKYTWADGSFYDGMWSNDKRGGRPIGDKGIFQLSNGDKYDGMFRQDKKDGIGYYWFKNGDYYEGQFKGDLIHGRGKYKWANGQEYDGMFDKEKMTGFGEMTYVNGEVYKGNWKKNKRDGVGVLTTPEGVEFKGPWKNNIMNGTFTIEYPDGREVKGKWVNGIKQ